MAPMLAEIRTALESFTDRDRLIMLAVAAGSVSVLVGLHYEALRLLAGLNAKLRCLPRVFLALTILALMAVHFVEIGMVAIIYAVVDGGSLGHIVSGSEASFGGRSVDYFYFSATTYSTVGFGDYVPKGPLRLVVASESVCGLMLVAWSASFTYLLMHTQWRDAFADKDD